MKFAPTWNSMFHLCACDKVTTALCVQAAGACQSTQCKNLLSEHVRHILWGVERYFWHLAVSVVNQAISAFIDQLLNTNAD